VNIDIAFPIDLPTHTVHFLTPEDSSQLQGLYDRCLDYMLLVDGHPAGSNAGAKAFQDVPPGKSLTDKIMVGVLEEQNELVGVLDAIRGYPESSVWWIGLFILAPEARSQGFGKEIIQGFVEFARKSGVQYIMLGVVEENFRAFQFWSNLGFEVVRETAPQQFGKKMQVVKIMALKLV
jgi:ribosomal protein S18 acetylase RimI-like enzyme